MNIYHAIIVCPRDAHLAGWHLEHVDLLGLPIQGRCFYFNQPLQDCVLEAPRPYHVLPFLEIYENLPLKTYGMLKHALAFSASWTHLLKADINSYPTFVDCDLAEHYSLIGFCGSDQPPGRTNHFHPTLKVHQGGLAEPHLGPTPTRWVGGPAYMLSRNLAEAIVARGPWAARAWPYEDVMVSQIAIELGQPAQPGVNYWTDGHEHRNPAR